MKYKKPAKLIAGFRHNINFKQINYLVASTEA